MNSTNTTTMAAVPSGPSTGPNTLCTRVVRLVAGSTTCTGMTRSFRSEVGDTGRAPFASGVVFSNCLPSSWMVAVASASGLFPLPLMEAIFWLRLSL